MVLWRNVWNFIILGPNGPTRCRNCHIGKLNFENFQNYTFSATIIGIVINNFSDLCPPWFDGKNSHRNWQNGKKGADSPNVPIWVQNENGTSDRFWKKKIWILALWPKYTTGAKFQKKSSTGKKVRKKNVSIRLMYPYGYTTKMALPLEEN